MLIEYGPTVQLVREFAEAVASGDVETGALIIAGHALCTASTEDESVPRRALDVNAVRAAIDDGRRDIDRLADGVPAPELADLLRHLFGPHGFAGNTQDYYNPANSVLPLVIRSRVGNPITLSVLAMAVGRRIGIKLEGVGMPGHFILRTTAAPPTWVDPFGGGTLMDADDAQALMKRATGGRVAFAPEHLHSVPGEQILARMLANLQMTYAHREAHRHLAWVGRLTAPLAAVRPGVTASIAAHLARVGRYDHAAGVYAAAAEFETGKGRDRLAAKADELWSRLN